MTARPASEAAPHLAPREEQILTLLADGRPSKHVARDLRLAHSTVRNYLQNAYRHLGVQNLVGALHTAVRARLLDTCPTCGRPTEGDS